MLQQGLHNKLWNIVHADGIANNPYNIAETNLVFGFNPNHRIERIYGIATTATANEEFISPLIKTFDLSVPFPVSALTLQIASTSNTDSFALGTGVMTVRIVGLLTGFIPIILDVNMDGQTPVNIPQDMLRINDMFAWTYGTPGAGGRTQPVGTIWIGSGAFANGVPANKFKGIAPENTSSRDAIWSISADALVARIIKLLTFIRGKKAAVFTLYIQLFQGESNVWLKAPLIETDAAFDVAESLTDPLIGGVDLVAAVQAEADTSVGIYMPLDYLTGVD